MRTLTALAPSGASQVTKSSCSTLGSAGSHPGTVTSIGTSKVFVAYAEPLAVIGPDAVVSGTVDLMTGASVGSVVLWSLPHAAAISNRATLRTMDCLYVVRMARLL